MTGPVVPPGGEERERLARILCDTDAQNGAATWDEADEQGRDDYRRMADAVLAFADTEGRRRAAEELLAAADSLTDRVRTWVLNLLRDRAAALAPENARPE